MRNLHISERQTETNKKRTTPHQPGDDPGRKEGKSMTRKRYINLVRALMAEIAKGVDHPNMHKGWEIGFRSSAVSYRAMYPDGYSYEELFNLLKPLAHKYGIGGY